MVVSADHCGHIPDLLSTVWIWVLLGFCLVLAKPETSLAQLCNTTNPILCVLLGNIDLDLLFFIGGWL